MNMRSTYCVVGATRGTGLQIAQQLLQRGRPVRAVARDPDKARRLLGQGAQVFAADVTARGSLRAAFDADCQAIFYAADPTGGIAGRSFFGSARMIREVSYQGLVNVVEAARAGGFSGRIVLLSGMGADRPSLAGGVLNAIKGNLQKNQPDRRSGWPAAYPRDGAGACPGFPGAACAGRFRSGADRRVGTGRSLRQDLRRVRRAGRAQRRRRNSQAAPGRCRWKTALTTASLCTAS
jgi:hypothetical protein